MSTDLVTVTVHTPLREAAALLRKHDIHHLPVVDPQGRLEGMLSQSDFLKLLDPATGENPSVTTIMTAHLAKLEPDDALRTAANLFSLNRFHALPVVEGKKLVGILTTLDVIKFVDREVPALKDYKA